MPPIPPVWHDAFRVRAYEIDPAGRLTLPTLCNYFQETAGNHATAFDLASDQLLAGGIAWVLARLQVEVERYPAWREDVTVETWPSAFDGLYAQRDFVASDEHCRTLARATSQWFVMDVARRRPIRLPSAVAEIERPDRPHALDPDRSPLPNFGEPDAERLFSVRRHDLDLNQHVNNVRCVEWALEAVPEAVRDAHTLRRLDVHLRAESVYGDTVRSACPPPRLPATASPSRTKSPATATAACSPAPSGISRQNAPRRNDWRRGPAARGAWRRRGGPSETRSPSRGRRHGRRYAFTSTTIRPCVAPFVIRSL